MEKSEEEILFAKRHFLRMRSTVIGAIRDFFSEEGFLEVQTPILTSAPAPEPHIKPTPADSGRFLSTSPELHMKRLLAAGYDKIFQITQAFRQGERGRLHHPEFTILEWYRSEADYKWLQEDCRNLVLSVSRRAVPGNRISFRDRALDPTQEWRRLSVREAYSEFAGWIPGPDPPQDRFDMDMVEKVEPNLGFPAPCILEDYPRSQAALARLKPGDPDVAERFELYWGGIELANGFTELTDPVEQSVRFERTLAVKKDSEGIEYPMPEAFLRSLEHMPPSAGIAFGIDRFVMILSGAQSLDDVVAFPPEIA